MIQTVNLSFSLNWLYGVNFVTLIHVLPTRSTKSRLCVHKRQSTQKLVLFLSLFGVVQQAGNKSVCLEKAMGVTLLVLANALEQLCAVKHLTWSWQYAPHTHILTETKIFLKVNILLAREVLHPALSLWVR